MSIETSAGEEVEEWNSKDEEELIETDLIEYRGQRRWAFHNNSITDRRSKATHSKSTSGWTEKLDPS